MVSGNFQVWPFKMTTGMMAVSVWAVVVRGDVN